MRAFPFELQFYLVNVLYMRDASGCQAYCIFFKNFFDKMEL